MVMVLGALSAFWMRSLASSSAEQITSLAQVNLLGAMLLTRAVLPGMLERRHGAIITVGSLSGRVASEPLYSATKYGLRGFSLALRRQLAGTGVSVSLVSPGNIDTDMGLRRPEKRYHHLFQVLPIELQDAAFLDRIHAYLPGWEMP